FLIAGVRRLLDQSPVVVVADPPDPASQSQRAGAALAFPVRAHVVLPVRSFRAATAAARTQADTLTSARCAARAMAFNSLASSRTSSRARWRNSGGRPRRAVISRV